MIIWIMLCFVFQPLCGSLAEQFGETGYVEICDENHDAFDELYGYFDEMVEFLQTHRDWAQKLYLAKERFIRSKDRNFYSTDFFGLYDESEREGRKQISFYYSTRFHEFIISNYIEVRKIPPINNFLEACLEIQKPYGNLFNEAAMELGIEIFKEQVPLLLKVIKYLPSYSCSRPHYDGTAFSLFLHSTYNQSLLISPYKSELAVDDFSSPIRAFSNSILLIPGTLLTEFDIFPSPHIVLQNGKTRYATIAFAMRPAYSPQKIEFSHLPNFDVE